MEKIYMEENQKKNRNSKQLMYTVTMSFMVAVFALFSLASFALAAYGNRGGISYALPIEDDQFTMQNEEDENDATLSILSYSTWVNDSTGGDGNPTGWNIPIYNADGDTDYPVFCVQHNTNAGIGREYTKGSVIEDYGLLYLLSMSFANGVSVTDATGENARYVETWVTQTAIWMYLADKDSDKTESSLNYISAAHMEGIQNTKYLVLNKTTSSGPSHVFLYGDGTDKLYQKVVQLVNEAKAKSSARHLSVKINDSDPASIAEDKSFYQSPIVTVTGDPADTLSSYDVTVDGVEGAYLVNEAGNTLNATNVPAGTKFYVRVPADKVGTETIDVTVNVKGHFNTLTGSYFTTDGTDENGKAFQKVVTVTGDNIDVLEGDSFQIIPTPPTGMNAVQTIYFIGLIVLLCGVGIVYANAKPVESKQ